MPTIREMTDEERKKYHLDYYYKNREKFLVVLKNRHKKARMLKNQIIFEKRKVIISFD
jgi:hypothetical protein